MVVEENSRNPKVDLAFRRKKNAEEMKHQVVSFALRGSFLTIVAFITVGYDGIDEWLKVPFIDTACMHSSHFSAILFHAYES